MRLSVEWIKEYVNIDADAETIADSLTMAGLEVEEKAQSDLGEVLDIKVTPNRGDCLSVIGVARELSAAYKVQMKSIFGTDQKGDAAAKFSVHIETPVNCNRYCGRMVKNFKVGPSPDWMQARLIAAGMRPINNIVDITNYVMLEMGQPLHAFDFDTLKGGKVIIRQANADESIKTLDGETRELTPNMMVIADAERPIAIAGVMGGMDTEVSDTTKTLLLESAAFNPLSVRRTAKALDMRTEASYRFERGVDPNGAKLAIDRVCKLIQETGAGEIDFNDVDEVAALPATRSIRLRTDRVCKMLGFSVPVDVVIETLNRLGIVASDKHMDHTDFTIPSWRPDLVREIDLVEEVGRVLGYEHIPEKLPTGNSTQGGDSSWGIFAESIRERLAGAGIQETVGHSLIAESVYEDRASAHQRIAIRSALSADLSGLRRSLIPGLIDVLDRNARRGNSPLYFFEIGHVFHNVEGEYIESTSIAAALSGAGLNSHWIASDLKKDADFYTIKGLLELVLEGSGISGFELRSSTDSRLHPGRSADVFVGNQKLGVVGELHPSLVGDITVRSRVLVMELAFDALLKLHQQSGGFQSLSPFQAVHRDIAPRLTTETPYQDLVTAINELKIADLEAVKLSDVYTGPHVAEGTKSLTLSLTFRSKTSTLAEEQINESVSQIRAVLEKKCGATFLA